MATVQSQFRVKSVTEKELLVKELENGFTTFIEARENLYDNATVWNKLHQLSEGDVVTMTVESQNSSNTVWLVDSIASIE